MKKLPYSYEAEKAVLGAMLISKEALAQIAILSEDDFFVPDHKLIFSVIKSVHDKKLEVNVITVVEQFTNNNMLGLLEDKELIFELGENVVSVSSIEDYVKIIKDKTILRKLVILAEQVCKGWEKEKINDIGDYVAKVEKDTLAITRDRSVSGFKTSKEVLEIMTQKLFINGKSNGALTGVTSGFIELDKITNGFQKGDLIILAARPSMGKTALALNFLMNAAIKQNITVAMFSVEMQAELLMQRMLSATSGVNSNKIRKMQFTDKDWTKIDVAKKQLSNTKILIDDTPSIKLTELSMKARKLKEKYDDLGLIVIDYLQIVKASDQANKEGTQKAVTEISRGLKELARELNVPVIALSQLSRDSEKRDNKRPMLSDLRDSGAIEQDADIVLFIYREDYFSYQRKNKKDGNEKKEETNNESGLAEVSIAKHRNGATGEIKLVFLKEYSLFSNYSEIEEQPQ